MAWTDTGLKTCILPAVLTLKPLSEKQKERAVRNQPLRPHHGEAVGQAPRGHPVSCCLVGPQAGCIRRGRRWALHPGRCVLNPATRGLPKRKPQHRVRGRDSIRPGVVHALQWPNPPAMSHQYFFWNCVGIYEWKTKLKTGKHYYNPMSSRNHMFVSPRSI